MTVIDWLLDSDPSIRWQVMRDLTAEPEETVAAERSRVATEGWGARLLALQGPDGQWGRDVLPSNVTNEGLPDVATRKLLRDLQNVSLEELSAYLDIDLPTLTSWENGEPDPDDERSEKYRGVVKWMADSIGTYNPAWTSTTYTLLLLREMGLDPGSEQALRAVTLVRDNSKWDHDGQDYFDGEVEPCVNGMAIAIGAYFGENVDGIVDRLLGEQLDDGGWNCEAEKGSIRSSFDTTISVLEGLLEYEKSTEGSADVTAARHDAHEYLLQRGMFRRESTGDVVDPAYTLFAYPTRWHYDVLRGLDYLRSAGVEPDERSTEAIDLVRGKQDGDGRWALENTHPGRMHFAMEEGDGKPSRWNTLRAMRVLAWAAHGPA